MPIFKLNAYCFVHFHQTNWVWLEIWRLGYHCFWTFVSIWHTALYRYRERERGRVSSVYCTIGEYRVESGRRAEHASCHSPTGRLLFAVSREVEVVSQASARLNTPRTGKVWASNRGALCGLKTKGVFLVVLTFRGNKLNALRSRQLLVDFTHL